MKQKFSRTISDENIHVLDPFTGTGTFITRLLQSGLIQKKDLIRKYTNELHANEIVLLAYYIAAVNIENAFHDLIGVDAEYKPFDGIVLTDTFQMGESDKSEELFSEMFPQNSERVEAQKKAPIRIIVGNPPYSIGQRSANDNAQNQSYEILDNRIAKTYAELSNAGLNKSLYDAYIKAFRWATDRIEDNGIICFVSNGAWIDGNSQDGFRKSLAHEFSDIYVFNLRGNQRTSGELSRKEGGKIFGSGSRTPISITLLVKNKNATHETAKIYYNDIGDYLKREDKLKIISDYGTVSNPKIEWKTLKPNEHGDWINHRNDQFGTFVSLQPENKFDLKCKSVFNTNAVGVATNRDVWVYNFSRNRLKQNMTSMIEFYNQQQISYHKAKEINNELNIGAFVDENLKKIKWTRSLKKSALNAIAYSYRSDKTVKSLYRPFCSLNLYYHKPFIESPGLSSRLFPSKDTQNLIIGVTGMGANKDFSVMVSNKTTDIQLIMNGQFFPLYYYEENNHQQLSAFDTNDDEYIQRDAVSNFIHEQAQRIYGNRISKEDIFYYVYGILHNQEYRKAFTDDLKKMLPRIPLVDETKIFWKFSKAGRALAELHINYETIPTHPNVKVLINGTDKTDNFADLHDVNYKVMKMRFPKKDQKDQIIYNSQIRIENIPLKAYEYIVNGKSAIEWILERYQVKVDKKSGIKNDPNDWSKEVGNPRYILDLLLSIINVSVQTMEIVDNLPKLEFDKK